MIMKRFKLHLAMFLALGIVATGFSGCAKDYDDDIRRIENESQARLIELRTELTAQLNAVIQQIYVLEHTTMPAAIKEEADKVRAELTVIKDALEARIAALETSQGVQDSRLDALEAFKSATETLLVTYGARIGTLEGQIIAINGRIDNVDSRLNTLTQNLSDLKARYDVFEQMVQALIPTLATKDELNSKIDELSEKILFYYNDALTKIGEAEARANTYTDQKVAELKAAIDDEYGHLIPDVANLLDKLGVDANGNLTVIDDLTGRITALEDLDLDGRLAVIEAEWPTLLDNVADLLGRVSNLEDFQDEVLNTTIPGILDRLDAIDGTGGYMEQTDIRLDDIESDITAIGDENTGLLGQLFLADAALAAEIARLDDEIARIDTELATKAASADLDAAIADLADTKQALEQFMTETQTALADILIWETSVTSRLDGLDTGLEDLDAYVQREINAINEAISGTGGILERLTALETGVADLTSRVDALEENVNALLGRIQSLTFVAETSSGRIQLTKAGANYEPFTATFLVSPADKAAAIADGISAGTIDAKFIVNETATRAITTGVTFTIDATSAVAGAADGTISLDVTPAGLNVDMFYQIALQLTDTATPNGTNVITSFIPVESSDVFAGAVYTATSNLFTDLQGTPRNTYITTPVRKWFQGTGATGESALVYPDEANFLHCLEGNAAASHFMNIYNTQNTSTNGINILPVMEINGESLAAFAANNNLDYSNFVVGCVNPVTEYLYSTNTRVDAVATTRLLGVSNDGRLRPYSSNWNLTYNQGYSKVSVEFYLEYDGETLWRGFAYILVQI